MSKVQLYQGDCVEFMKTLESKSVDATITDPPYGVDLASWDKRSPYEILPELLRVSRGLVLWFGGALHLQEDLLSFSVPPQRVLIWHVTFSLTPTKKHGMYYRYHPLYTWQLPKTQDGLTYDVIDVAQAGHHEWDHPATKPIQLLKRLVGMTDRNATVFDPFMGSGTTGVACVQTGRGFIGCEIDPGYYAIAKLRIEEAQMQGRLDMDEPEVPSVKMEQATLFGDV
jgi:predicted RNA methylase